MSGRPSISITRSRGTRSVGRTAFKYSDMPLTKSRKYTLLAASVIAAVLIIDQIIKVWIKTHFYIGEDFEIASWFHLRFVQNDGMAFGLNLFSDRVRTFIRIAVLAALGFYCADLVERKARRARLVTVGVITGLWAVYTLWCFFKGNLFDIPLSSGFAKLALSLFRVVLSVMWIGLVGCLGYWHANMGLWIFWIVKDVVIICVYHRSPFNLAYAFEFGSVIGVDVAVDEKFGPIAGEEVAEAGKATVGQVFHVVDPRRRGMGNQDIEPPVPFQLPPEPADSPAHFPLCILVFCLGLVAHGAAQAQNPYPPVNKNLVFYADASAVTIFSTRFIMIPHYKQHRRLGHAGKKIEITLF